MSTTRNDPAVAHRGRRPNAGAFLGHWQIWFCAIPPLGTVCFFINSGVTSIFGTQAVAVGSHRFRIRIGLFDHTSGALIIWCVASAATLLAVVAISHGLFVTKRVPLVVAHLAGSVWLTGVLLSVTTVVGWPLWWVILYTTFAGVLTLSWNLTRSDALRSDPREKDGAKDDTFGKLIGLPRAVVSQPKVDEHFITAEIDPGLAKTHGDVDGAMEAIEQQVAAALPGRSWTEYNQVTKRVKAVFMHTDPLKPWPLWQGPSNVGGSFELGAVAGVYADSQPEVIRLAKYRHPQTGEDVMPSGLVSTGMTRSGKSGHGAVIWTDAVLTRCDAGMVYLDGAKPGQSLAGDVMDDLVLFATKTEAGSIAPMLNLLDVIGSKLVPYRSKILGAAGHRDWSHQAFLDTGIAALLVVADEGDLIAASKKFRDLVTKCLSVGIFFHLLIPRMDGESLDTTARTAIGQTLAFGQGDDYSDDMALSDTTKKRIGKKLYNWGNRYPGYHVYDGAGGVDENRWAMDARSYKAEFAQLKEAIVAGRECRANSGRVLTAGEIDVLGKAWSAYTPPGGRFWEHPTQTMAGKPLASGNDEREGQAVTDSDDPYNDKDWRNADADEDIPVPLPDADDREPGDVAYYSTAERTNPVPEESDGDPAEDVPWSDAGGKPAAPGRQAARDELHRAVREIASRMDDFENSDLIEEYRFRASQSWFSEFLYALDRGEVIVPGITITNVGRGAWHVERTASAVIEGQTAGV